MARPRRTKGAGSVFQDAKGTWHYKRYLGTDPMTGKRRVIELRAQSKVETPARNEAKIADYERTGLLPNHHSPTTADYAERWLADYRTRVKPNRGPRQIQSRDTGPLRSQNRRLRPHRPAAQPP